MRWPRMAGAVVVTSAVAAVEKLFFAVIGVLVFLYVFFSVGGSFERKFGFLSTHPWAVTLTVLAVVVALILGGLFGWRWLKRLWEQAKHGGRILSDRPGGGRGLESRCSRLRNRCTQGFSPA